MTHLKRRKNRYTVVAENKHYTFRDIHKALTFIGDLTEYGADHTEAVYAKIHCLYELCVLRHGKYKAPDKHENALRKMLLECKSRSLMDIAVRDIITGKCTLNDVLKRKGFLQ